MSIKKCILIVISSFSSHLQQLGLVGEEGGLLKIGVGVAAVALGGYLLYRYLQPSSPQSPSLSTTTTTTTSTAAAVPLSSTVRLSAI